MTVAGAIWRDQLTSQERATLGRDDGPVAEPRPDVLVVGGGILGVATAAACHEAGLGSVLLIETGRLGAGATGGATGLLIPEPHQWSDPEPFVDLERASLERWRDLERVRARRGRPGRAGLARPGPAPWRVRRAPARRPSSGWTRARSSALVPGLARPMEGALIRHQARLNPLRAVVRLAAGLPAVVTGVAATGVTMRGGRLIEVGHDLGRDDQPGAVVFATGLPPVLDGLPLDIPSDRVKGHLLVTEPDAGATCPASSPRWRPRSRTAGCWPAARSTGRREPGGAPGRDRHDHGRPGRALPGAARTWASPTQWCCFRPRHPDRRPVIDRVPGLRQRLADLGALPHRHPERAGHRGRAGPLDRRGRAARRARPPGPRPGSPPAASGRARPEPVSSLTSRRSSGSRWVIRCRSRYSSSGITVRRVVSSACRASAAVNGCGSPARIPAAALRPRRAPARSGR